MKLAQTAFALMTLGAATFLLGGCASTQDGPLLIAPEVQQQHRLMPVAEVKLVDKRTNKALAVINKQDKIEGDKLPAQLQNWLDNSIHTASLGRKTLNFNLLNYTSFISQETLSFTAESMMEWQVEIKSKNRTWTKTYQSTINEEGPLKKDRSSIEATLKRMAHSLLQQTMTDPEFTQAIAE